MITWLNSSNAFSLAIFWGRGPTRWGPGAEDKSQGSRNTNAQFRKVKKKQYLLNISKLIIHLVFFQLFYFFLAPLSHSYIFMFLLKHLDNHGTSLRIAAFNSVARSHLFFSSASYILVSCLILPFLNSSKSQDNAKSTD